MLARIGLADVPALLADHHRQFQLMIIAPVRVEQTDLAAEADQAAGCLEEQAAVGNVGDVGAPVLDAGVVVRFGNVLDIVDRRVDDLGRVGHWRGQLHVFQRQARGGALERRDLFADGGEIGDEL